MTVERDVLGAVARAQGDRASDRVLLVLALAGAALVLALGVTVGAGISGRWPLATILLLALAGTVTLLWRQMKRRTRSQRRAQESPRLALVLLDNLMAHFPGHIYFKDRESRFVRISRSLARHFGLKHEGEALGRSDADMFSGEHAEQAMRDEQEIVRTGRPLVDVEEKETWEDGRVTWVSTSKLPLRDDDGQTIGTFGVSLDVTARHEMQDALTESQAFFDSLVNSLPQNIYCKDPEGHFTFGNRAFCSTVGQSLEELLGKTDLDLYPAELAGRYREEDQRVMRTGVPLESTEEHTDPGGRRRFVQFVKTPRYDAARKIVGVQGIFWDVTEQQVAEERLARERDLLHALMDNIPDPIFFKDTEGRYTRVNRAQARLLGLDSPEQAVGRSTLESDEAGIISSGAPVVGKQEQVTSAGGASRWMLTSKAPIREAGRTTGLVGIARDITERKEAEQALERGLEAFLRFASAVAEGDLTRRAAVGEDTLGRIGRSVNTVLDNFSAMLLRVRDAALAVASAAGEILAASRQIAQGAQRQTDEVNSTSTAVEEMAASMAQVSKNAKASSDSAMRSQGHVEHGDHSVSDTFAAMTRIDEAVRHTADKMHMLESRSRQISEVIELIDDVAAQTKLLSLNAAIEAAHAGEAGLGFNVVAEEIRKLADRTARATKDVGALIETVQLETAEALAAMEGGVREVEQGRTLASQARQALAEISGTTKEATRLSGDISSAAREQAGVTRELARTMQTIAAITLESSTGAQQTAKTVQDLVRLSDQLNEALARFKVTGTGEA